jgi:hypothetical protein
MKAHQDEDEDEDQEENENANKNQIQQMRGKSTHTVTYLPSSSASERRGKRQKWVIKSERTPLSWTLGHVVLG